jgi:hypothetical protein
MKAKIKLRDRCSLTLTRRQSIQSGIALRGCFIIECFDKDGTFKWRQTCPNLIVNAGLQHALDVLMSGSTQTDPWYVGLTDGTPTVAAGDTMASHAGWTEITAYDETGRQAYVEVRSGQSMSNTASKATFTISGTTTVGGAFLTSASDKGGSTGTLLCGAAAAEGDRSVVDDDVLNIEYTFTAADDGA